MRSQIVTSKLGKGGRRFPVDFMFQLNEKEFENLRFQFGTSSRWGGRRYLPYAFTEQGVAMSAHVYAGKEDEGDKGIWETRE